MSSSAWGRYVDWLLLQLRLYSLHLWQAVSDNKGAMKALMKQLTARIKAVSEACAEAKSDDATRRIDNFVWY